MKRIKVNLKQIKELNPCKDRLDNYIKHYEGKEFTVKQFLALEHISHNDKCWVAFRLMPKKNLRFAAGEIAKSVLDLYEAKCPNDNRPRKAIKQALAKRGNKKAAYYAAASSDAYAAYAAYAAANAAYAAANAAYAAANAAYATGSNADGAVYYACAAATVSKKVNQQKINIKIIAKYWR